MLPQYDPSIVVINGRYINVSNIYSISNHNLSIQLDYFSGDKELFQFGSVQELDKAQKKLYAAQQALDFGTNYAAR